VSKDVQQVFTQSVVALDRLASTYCRRTPALVDTSRASPLELSEQPAKRGLKAARNSPAARLLYAVECRSEAGRQQKGGGNLSRGAGRGGREPGHPTRSGIAFDDPSADRLVERLVHDAQLRRAVFLIRTFDLLPRLLNQGSESRLCFHIALVPLQALMVSFYYRRMICHFSSQ